MDAVAVAGLALVFSLVAICVAIYVTLRRGSDTDFDELAAQVTRLAKRARADTMRRVRAEAKGLPADDSAAVDASAPPELRIPAQTPQQDSRALKAELRKRVFGTGGPH